MKMFQGFFCAPASTAFAAALALVVGGAHSATVPAKSAKPVEGACGALKKGSLGKKSVTGLPIDGARIESALSVPAEPDAYCKVAGQIAGAKGAAPLRFRLDLPHDWNRRAVQFAEGIDSPRLAVDPARARAAGYATFGPLPDAKGAAARPSISGSGEAAVVMQKKLRDTAAELLARRHNRFSDRFYLVTGIAGADQALALAARQPRAYRGMLVDASDAGAAAAATPPAAGVTDPALLDYSTTIAPYAANGGKLLILAPTAEPAAAALPIVGFQRDQVARKGRRYADDLVRLFAVPDAAAASATDWLPVLVEWSENLKPPAASMAGLPRRP